MYTSLAISIFFNFIFYFFSFLFDFSRFIQALIDMQPHFNDIGPLVEYALLMSSLFSELAKYANSLIFF